MTLIEYEEDEKGEPEKDTQLENPFSAPTGNSFQIPMPPHGLTATIELRIEVSLEEGLKITRLR